MAERFAWRFVGVVVISSITLAELACGLVSSGDADLLNRAALASFLEDVPDVPFEADAASAYGPTRFASRER